MAELELTHPRYVRSEKALWRRFHDGIVVLGPTGDRPIVVSHPGGEIWRLLATPTSTRSIAQVLGLEFGMDAERILQDVDGVIDALGAIAAIEIDYR